MVSPWYQTARFVGIVGHNCPKRVFFIMHFKKCGARVSAARGRSSLGWAAEPLYERSLKIRRSSTRFDHYLQCYLYVPYMVDFAWVNTHMPTSSSPGGGSYFHSGTDRTHTSAYTCMRLI